MWNSSEVIDRSEIFLKKRLEWVLKAQLFEILSSSPKLIDLIKNKKIEITDLDKEIFEELDELFFDIVDIYSEYICIWMTENMII